MNYIFQIYKQNLYSYRMLSGTDMRHILDRIERYFPYQRSRANTKEFYDYRQ